MDTNDMFNPYDGKPINKSDADRSKITILIRFNKLTKVCKV